jgi:tRNA/rRNA methyltransferase
MSDRGELIFDPGNSPAFVMVEPQLGDNIGVAARAMLNFGLSDLRLVNPRDGWPNPKAYQFASGADVVLDKAKVVWNVEDATADMTLLFAATARDRYMQLRAISPAEMAAEARAEIAKGGKVGVLFGRERNGLENEDVARAHAIVSIPVNPGFPSLNVAQSMAVLAYELRNAKAAVQAHREAEPPASQDVFDGLMRHLFEELEEGGYFFPPEKTPIIKDNLRAALQRARLTDQECATLRGAIKALSVGRGAKWRKRFGEVTNRP